MCWCFLFDNDWECPFLKLLALNRQFGDIFWNWRKLFTKHNLSRTVQKLKVSFFLLPNVGVLALFHVSDWEKPLLFIGFDTICQFLRLNPSWNSCGKYLNPLPSFFSHAKQACVPVVATSICFSLICASLSFIIGWLSPLCHKDIFILEEQCPRMYTTSSTLKHLR